MASLQVHCVLASGPQEVVAGHPYLEVVAGQEGVDHPFLEVVVVVVDHPYLVAVEVEEDLLLRILGEEEVVVVDLLDHLVVVVDLHLGRVVVVVAQVVEVLRKMLMLKKIRGMLTNLHAMDKLRRTSNILTSNNTQYIQRIMKR